MSRLWLMLIPPAAPILLMVADYLYRVVWEMLHTVSYHHEGVSRLIWESQQWWDGFKSHPDAVLAWCLLAFLVGSILALVLHLFLPRRTDGLSRDD